MEKDLNVIGWTGGIVTALLLYGAGFLMRLPRASKAVTFVGWFAIASCLLGTAVCGIGWGMTPDHTSSAAYEWVFGLVALAVPTLIVGAVGGIHAYCYRNTWAHAMGAMVLTIAFAIGIAYALARMHFALDYLLFDYCLDHYPHIDKRYMSEVIFGTILKWHVVLLGVLLALETTTPFLIRYRRLRG